MQDLANMRARIVIFRRFFKIIIQSIFERSNTWCGLISSDRSFQARIVDGMNEL